MHTSVLLCVMYMCIIVRQVCCYVYMCMDKCVAMCVCCYVYVCTYSKTSVLLCIQVCRYVYICMVLLVGLVLFYKSYCRVVAPVFCCTAKSKHYDKIVDRTFSFLIVTFWMVMKYTWSNKHAIV